VICGLMWDLVDLALIASYTSMIIILIHMSLFLLIQIWLAAGFVIHVHIGCYCNCAVLLLIVPFRLL
jgi:hypothetical protein